MSRLLSNRRRRPARTSLLRGLPALAAFAACTTGPSTQPGPGSSAAGGPTSRVVYRIVDTAGPSPQVSTVVVEVAAPYRARTLTYEGDGTTVSLGGFAWTDGALYTIKADGTVQQSTVVTPGEAGSDSRLALVLPVAEHQHLVRQSGHGSRLGIDCTKWESKDPLDGTTFGPATASDHTTSCVDSSGRILDDTWYIGGALVRTRVATQVGFVPPLDDKRLFGGATPEPAPSGVGEEEVAAANGPADHDFGVRAAAPPAGFTFQRSVVFRDNIAGETAPVTVRVGQVSAYRRGTDLLVIRRAVNTVGRPSLPARGELVDLGALGKGKLEPLFTGLQVSFVSSTGVLVLVTGSIGETDLLSWVRAITIGPLDASASG